MTGSPRTQSLRARIAESASAWTRAGAPLSRGMLAFTTAVLAALLSPILAFRLERDQAHFAYFALLWLRGLTPYAQLHAHQWPGQYALYAGAFAVFGVRELAVRQQDLLIQLAGALALALLGARLARPVVGLLAAIFYVTAYVTIGPWSTANRETYQIALLLPVLYWAIYADVSPAVDRVLAFAAGVVIALVVFIKPTVGLVVVACAALVLRRGRPAERRARAAIVLVGLSIASTLLMLPFLGHFAAFYESLVTFNREIYARVVIPPEMRASIPGTLIASGVGFLPLACWGLRGDRRAVVLWLLVVEATLVASIVVQGKALGYHFALVTPFHLLGWLLCADALATRLPEQLRRVSPHARAVVALVVAGVAAAVTHPRGGLVAVDRYVRARVSDDPRVNGVLGPVWDRAAIWLRAHRDPIRERVFVFGADDGLQFLLRLAPLSATTTAIGDLRLDALNRHPLIVARKRELMEALRRERPEWILVATFDESWLTRSGSDSIAAFPDFGALLAERYELVDAGDYRFYRRR